MERRWGFTAWPKTLNKKTHIVIDNITSSIRPLIQAFEQDPDYDAHMFVNCRDAKEIADENTLVVVVDTNNPKYTECEGAAVSDQDHSGSGSPQAGKRCDS